MESQKIANLLHDSDNESSKFATRKWYIINDQNNGQYGEGNEIDSTTKFETKVIKPNLCNYSDAYILVTGNIAGASSNANAKVAFKNCAPMYNLFEYSDNMQISLEVYNSSKEMNKI